MRTLNKVNYKLLPVRLAVAIGFKNIHIHDFCCGQWGDDQEFTAGGTPPDFWIKFETGEKKEKNTEYVFRCPTPTFEMMHFLELRMQKLHPELGEKYHNNLRKTAKGDWMISATANERAEAFVLTMEPE